MPKIPTLKEMLEAGVHFGHQISRWHPKAEKYIFGQKQNVHIIDLEQTQKDLEKVLEFVKDTAAKGGKILFLGTKKQAQDIVKKYATECGMPYLTESWLGGLFTNFKELSILIRKFNDMQKKQEKGELKKYTKKEQLVFAREIGKLQRRIGGIKDLSKTPEAIYIVDLKNEKTARAEAEKRKVKIVAICDTNIDPTTIDYCIPGNDDAVKSIEMMTRLVSEAVNEGKKEADKAEQAK